MKILCETTGNFQLVDYEQGAAVLAHDRPGVMLQSHFLSQRAAAGQLRVLHNVNDEATDQEFAKYVEDSENMELAIAAFVEAYALPDVVEKTADGEPAPAPAGRRKRGQAAE